MRTTAWAILLAAALALPALAESPAELRARARTAMESDDPAAAARLLEDAVKQTSEDAELWAELGNARLALSQFAPASQAFERAVKLAPDLGTAHYNLAYSLRKSGKLARAAEVYRVYLARYPSDADAHFGLGETLRGLDDKLAAAESYEKYATTEARPDRAQWVEKARTWARELRANEVQPVASGAAAPVLAFSQPESAASPAPVAAAAPAATTTAEPLVHPALAAGLQLLRGARFDEALVELRKAELARPEDAWVQAAIGSALLGLDEPADAAVRYTRALASATAGARPGIRLGLAECARAQGDAERAAADYRALVADEATPESLKAIARERLGR